MATMKDVARLAGVSTSTVSHVINNNRYVSDAIRDKVQAAVRELNYAPSALARSLKINRTHTIGMLVTTGTNPFFMEVVHGVELSCYERNYSVILCNCNGSIERIRNSMTTLLQKKVDGLLIMCTEGEVISEVLSNYPRLPVVMMDWSPCRLESDIIQDNAELGGEQATAYLIARGYRRIACIAGPLEQTPSQGRLQGYRRAMANACLPVLPGYEVEGDFEFNGGLQGMQQLLQLPEVPDAVFVGNDAMAVGVYQALYQAGLQVGRDIAVIGYDDIELARYLTPPLTTIHQPKNELGELAVETLLARLEDETTAPQIMTLTPLLVERDSVPRKTE
ncbi:MAG: ribose operon transcriptional repressor RbsR [Enterobacteriaceae bacterium]